MTESPVPLTALTEEQRVQAHSRFLIIRPALEDGVSQAQVARSYNTPASTVKRWVKRYREKALQDWQTRRSVLIKASRVVCLLMLSLWLKD